MSSFQSHVCRIAFLLSMFTDMGFLWALKQIGCLEENAETLRERTIKFYKGGRKYAYVSTFTFLSHFPFHNILHSPPFYWFLVILMIIREGGFEKELSVL